ncbi:hypothetical protein [Sphingobacterium hotanense]|uniref:hypothetical protein n=1 Tax=Sphingobacterium hotanense TaxID=649196 RepID=UPI0021A5270C|nr:hypothetical protein [Sphingobacterium hotanense]MCT1526921.1 hypothetical protein [Sphingobacterium hotanense]
MANEKKQITNHQLGVALAAIIERTEGNMRTIQSEMKNSLEEYKEIQKVLINQIRNSNIKIETKELKSLRDSISTDAIQAEERIKSSLRSVYLNKYLIILHVLLVVMSFGVMWFAHWKMEKSNKKLVRLEEYYLKTSKYFEENPKVSEKFRFK